MESKFLNERISFAKQIIDELLKKYEYASILGKDVYGKVMRVLNIQKNINDSFDKQRGFVIKVFHQNIYSEYSFSKLEKDLIPSIIENVEKNLTVSESLLKDHMNLSLLDDEPLVKDFDRPREGKSYTTDEIFDIANKFTDEIAKKSDKIIQCGLIVEQYTVNSFFISRNRYLTQSFSWSMVFPLCVVREGDVIKYARRHYLGNNLEEQLKRANVDGFGVVDDALELLKATPIEPGEYDIITHPSISGLIAHEAFGHGVEMDMFVKNRAKSRQYINKPVASSLVSMHDGAAATYSCASYFFDDDGVLAQDTLIIDKGILKTGICDVIAANELKTKSTGNSRRESPFRKAYTRMTNTFFEPGEDNLDDMIKSIKHGYMLFETSNGMEDPKNWNIQCVAEYAKEIKNGKFTGKIVSPVVMSGYVPDLLMSISAVSKDFEVIGAGHCGKGHKEWVPVSDGGPYLKARCKLS